MRNAEKDAALMAERKERLLEAGFRLFSEKTIEATSLLEITQAAEVGTVMLYRYYGNKPGLVVAVVVKAWTEVLEDSYRRFDEQGYSEKNAASQFRFYLSEFERLYREYKPLLRLNENFTTYAKHEKLDREQMAPITEFVLTLLRRMDAMLVKGEQDGTLQTELGEGRIVVASLHTMLAVVGKYAGGLLYAGDNEEQNIREIRFLSDMIYETCVRKDAENKEEST